MRGILVLAGGVVVMILAVVFSCAALRSPAGAATPEKAARAYFGAWGRGDFAAMRDLVDGPPDDFADRHRALTRDLHIQTVTFEPGRPVRHGDNASVDYKVTRDLSGIGTWSFHAVLRLVRGHGRWMVRWSPATLYPSLAEGGRLAVTRLDEAPSTPVAADGKALPAASGVQPYLTEVGDRFGDSGDDAPGWAIELSNPGDAVRRLKVFGGDHFKPIRTTLDRHLQDAAESAVGSEPAALVAVRPSTGEILAVADRLEEPEGAFLSLNPPGSTFKVVTGAALLEHGTSPATPVACPAVTVAAQRTIHNDGDFALGEVPLTQAFAESCNTTFARLGVAAGARRLSDAAASFGFGAHFDPGVPAYSGDFPRDAEGNALAEASIGQGTVQATTLDMAVVAAAVADGTYRSPRLVPAHLAGHRTTRRLPVAVTGGLRAMMGDVVRYGTAAHAGLPAGTHGKTGTAEYGAGGDTHAWFIGYRGDLAFAVFVERGGEGGRVAAPIAARFLTVAKS
jgi:Penicillin binding protein transpeptidase domain/NTF2-like N-terminal transpeptidase domain